MQIYSTLTRSLLALVLAGVPLTLSAEDKKDETPDPKEKAEKAEKDAKAEKVEIPEFAASTDEEEVKSGLDFGDSTSETLVGGAWGCLDAGKKDEALVFVKRCIRLHLEAALEEQEKLKDFAPEESAAEHWAVNDVGTSFFILGKVLEEKDDKKGAKESYKYLSEKLSYSQCWDAQGWFWKPAEAADEKLLELGDEE